MFKFNPIVFLERVFAGIEEQNRVLFGKRKAFEKKWQTNGLRKGLVKRNFNPSSTPSEAINP